MDEIPATLRTVETSGEAPAEFVGGLIEAEWRPSGVEVVMTFERETAPLLPIGEPVELSVKLATGDMLGHGRVFGRRDDEGLVDYRLTLDHEGTLQLGAVLNRREAVRVRPAEDDLIFLRLDWSNGERDLLPVHELSGTGLSILVDDSLEARLLEVYELRFLLHLSGIDALVLDGQIKNRAIEGSQVALGIEFDAERTARFGHVQDQIYRWVAGRYQRQIETPGWAV